MLRDRLGMTQAQLARAIELTQPQISKIERRRTPLSTFSGKRISRIRRLCEERGIPFPEEAFLGHTRSGRWDDLFSHGPRVTADFLEEREQPLAQERDPF